MYKKGIMSNNTVHNHVFFFKWINFQKVTVKGHTYSVKQLNQ